MKEIDTGGPAFPLPLASDGEAWMDTEDYSPPNKGMSLRDWFAGMAMQAIIQRVDLHTGDVFAGTAVKSYAFADAMIYQRTAHEKEEGSDG